MNFLQGIGVVSGLTNVWLTARQNMWCWPIGLVYIFVSFAIFLQARLYGELASHIVFFVLTIYGWYRWYKGAGGKDLPVTRLSKSQQTIALMTTTTVAVILVLIFTRLTDNASPYLDAGVTSLNFTGMWLQARKKIESWIVWAFVNVFSVILYAWQGLFGYAFLYLVFFGFAFNGLMSWRKSALQF